MKPSIPRLLLLSAGVGFTLQPQFLHSQISDRAIHAACEVTIPNKSQTPVKNFGGTVTYAPDYKGPRDLPDPYSHGNGKLWTILWPEGTVLFQPNGAGSIGEDGSLTMKWPWYRSVKGRLTIRGRRLDAPAPPLRAEISNGYRERGFQATVLIFPTEGCWEVTGQVGETTLTFVTRVVKLKQARLLSQASSI